MMAMNVIIFGVQGSGKGTQAEKLVQEYHLTHISPGELFREEIKKGTALGKKLKPYLDKGILVPKDINFAAIQQALKKINFQNFILDGFPRTEEQAIFLDTIATIDLVLEIHISDKEAMKRISSRRVCSKCGAGYNTISIKPKKAGICDQCKGSLIVRDDDKPAAVAKRLQIYHTATEPLKDFYRKKGVLLKINGEQPIEKVFREIQAKLKKAKI
ncbi:nucleoside monophosphate kinase [Candidatus Woesearchaeota archaeon]|nr:MAG: nucleoside monophosphate kinase [Candidatus Woesearchaeota archaeon]